MNSTVKPVRTNIHLVLTIAAWKEKREKSEASWTPIKVGAALTKGTPTLEARMSMNG
jgi:hypothetical protein